MSNLQQLIATINNNIRQNGQNEITGPVLNNVLNQIVSTLGTGYRYVGYATPQTVPITTDNKVFYVTDHVGLYTNFGTTFTIPNGYWGIIYYDTAWHLQLMQAGSGGGGGEETIVIPVTMGDEYSGGGGGDVYLETDLTLEQLEVIRDKIMDNPSTRVVISFSDLGFSFNAENGVDTENNIVTLAVHSGVETVTLIISIGIDDEGFVGEMIVAEQPFIYIPITDNDTTLEITEPPTGIAAIDFLSTFFPIKMELNGDMLIEPMSQNGSIFVFRITDSYNDFLYEVDLSEETVTKTEIQGGGGGSQEYYNLRLMSQTERATLFTELTSNLVSKRELYQRIIWNGEDGSYSACIKKYLPNSSYSEYVDLFFRDITVRLNSNGDIIPRTKIVITRSWTQENFVTLYDLMNEDSSIFDRIYYRADSILGGEATFSLDGYTDLIFDSNKNLYYRGVAFAGPMTMTIYSDGTLR